MRIRIHRGTKEMGGMLPQVPWFRDYDNSLLGVVISHPHLDHYELENNSSGE